MYVCSRRPIISFHMDFKGFEPENAEDSLVTVQESPVTSIKRCGNLTGNIRLINDHVIDIYSCVQAWNESVVVGTAIINDLINVIQKEGLKNKMPAGQPVNQNVQLFCDRLGTVCDKLKSYVNQLERHYNSIEAILKLEQKDGSDEPIFLTWPLSKFRDISEQIYNMYKKEYNVKYKIKQCLGLNSQENTTRFYAAVWLHEVYIEDDILDSLKSMLRETSDKELSA